MSRKRSPPTPPEREQLNLLRFFGRAGRLKTEPRLGWFVKLGLERPESVADHSYRTALMAMVYADARRLDTGRAVKMALLHDLAEAIVGDSIPGQRSAAQKWKMESTAMQSVMADLPGALRREYLAAWEEFERGTTKEASLVRQMDKLEMAVQAYEYRVQDPARDVGEFLETARRSVKDPELKRLLELL